MRLPKREQFPTDVPRAQPSVYRVTRPRPRDMFAIGRTLCPRSTSLSPSPTWESSSARAWRPARTCSSTSSPFGAKGLIGIAVLGVLNVVFGVVAVGYAASLMGFKKLIGGMYPIIGWLGVALLVVLAVGWLRERSAVLREENLRRKLIRVLVRKYADDLEYTDEHRAQARTLAQASVVDGTELRREADSIAEQIADTQDDAAAYAREALPVDEALVEQAIEADRANG